MNFIVNADDFAVSESINKTILTMHKKGIVTSTSIIAAGECFDNAIEISRNNPKLSIGAHVCLDGPYYLGKEFHPVINNSTNGISTKREIAKNLLKFSIDESEVYKECCRQIEKIIDHHIQISHLDSHHHLHINFSVLNIMIRVAKKYKIPFIRTQKVLLLENQNFSNYCYRFCHQLYLKSRINAVDGIYEPNINENSNFEIDYNKILKLLTLKNPIIELILHPQEINDPQTKFFSSGRVMDLLMQRDLISYNDLN